jgi:phosphatidylinositol glycan class Z
MSPTQPYSHKQQWTIYLFLILLRFLGALYSLPGYIHPDEFFQGGQELFFGVPPLDHQLHQTELAVDALGALTRQYEVRSVPWEFEPQNAVRSIVPPAFMTLFPLRIYVAAKSLLSSSSKHCKTTYYQRQSPIHSSFLWTDSMNELSGREILSIPRLFMTILSLIFLDGSLWLLVIKSQDDKSKYQEMQQSIVCLLSCVKCGPPIEVIVLASSWPCLVFGIRPFTNTLEAIVLTVLVVIISLDLFRSQDSQQNNGYIRFIPACIGLTCSIGIFVRFTFAFFAFPAVIGWLWNCWRRSRYKVRTVLYDGIWLGSAFLATSTLFILADTIYYSSQTYNSASDGDLWKDRLKYIAPLNAFIYNSKSKNLAEHGLHPRITHAAVNMPMLFGPLALVGHASVARMLTGRGIMKSNNPRRNLINFTCNWVVISGLFVFSCAPHQEPRFLLPCLVPLVLLFGKEATGNTWVLFNFILFVFFGWLHQGGLVDVILHTPSITIESSTSSVFVYYKTYMPPTFLARGVTTLALGSSDQNQCMSGSADENGGTCSNHELNLSKVTCKEISRQSENIMLDLQGNDSSVLLRVLQGYLHCQHFDEQNHLIHMYLITPSSISQSLTNEEQSNSNANHGFEWEGFTFLKQYTSPRVHVSTEDWPAWDGSVINFLHRLELSAFEISCSDKI